MALQIITVNYGSLMEFVTARLPELFRIGMNRGAWAFSADIRERLGWGYSVAYLHMLTASDRLSVLVKRVLCDVFDSALTVSTCAIQLEI